MLRHMHQKRYQALKASTIKIRSLYAMSEEKAAITITIQKNWRRYIQRKRYLRAKKAIYKLQIGKKKSFFLDFVFIFDSFLLMLH